jgi:hypothetical protein
MSSLWYILVLAAVSSWATPFEGSKELSWFDDMCTLLLKMPLLEEDGWYWP